MAGMRVLLVEDFLPLARSVCQGLQEAGYAVDLAGDGAQALDAFQSAAYDAIVLDLMLPKVDGLTVLRRLRAKGSDIPVLVLTARDQLDDKVAGLDGGADDYLVKPFAFAELLARLRAVMRRRYGHRDSVIQIGELTIDLGARTVTRAGEFVPLSGREYAVLEYLACRRGQIVTRGDIWEHVYDFATEPSSNVVDVYIGYLRKKIDQGRPEKLIHTHRGLGYSLA
jgi:DNA-binding response OmpR family regulator